MKKLTAADCFIKELEEYFTKINKKDEERKAARVRRVKEKYPDCVYIIHWPRELFEKCYPGVEY